MCDEAKLKEWAISRRQLGVLAGAAAVTACAPDAVTGNGEGGADGASDVALTQTTITFETADGVMDGVFIHPSEGKHPAVIFWPDIASIRPAKIDMASRLAAEGFAVLIMNPYYRDVAGQQFADFAAWIEAGALEAVAPYRAKLDADSIGRDAVAAAAWLDEQDAVDTARGIGTEGYCMGGPFTVWSSAAVPDRIKAAASFHGGGLVREDDPRSPHNMLDQATATYLIAIARDDHKQEPSAKLLFAKAAGRAARPANIDVFDGDHGWTVPDSPSYSEAPAEKAYAAKVALYEAQL